MKIKIDEEKCINCGSCSSVCPDVFEMSDENKIQIKAGKEESDDSCVQEAIDICPVQAIEKEE